MRLMMRMVTIVYMLIFTGLGAWLVAFAMGRAISTESLTLFIQTVQQDETLRVAVGFTGAGVILFNLMVFQMSWARFRRQRTIAFMNPEGQVTISLGAIEDFIRKTTKQIKEIREMKSEVLASKRGIEVTTRLALWSEARIPEVTERVQSLIKTHVQEMLGIEDPVVVRVHVSKIVAREQVKGSVPEKVAEEPPKATSFEYN